MNKKTIVVVITLLSIVVLVVSYFVLVRINSHVVHDVAVTNVNVSGSQRYVGDNIGIYAVVENRGSVSETFNVTAYYDETEIAAETVDSLSSEANATVHFVWDTSRVAPGNFVVEVKVNPIPEESNTSDNDLSGGLILLRYKPAEAAVLYVDPNASAASIGHELIVEVKTANVTDLYGWELRLAYNNSVLNLTGITEGHLLTDIGQTFFSFDNSPMNGSARVYSTLVGNVPGASGNGTLATFRFNVTEAGTSFLNIVNATLVSSFEKDIDFSTVDGVFQTSP